VCPQEAGGKQKGDLSARYSVPRNSEKGKQGNPVTWISILKGKEGLATEKKGATYVPKHAAG